MVQQHHTLWNVSNEQHQYCPEFDVEVLNILSATARKE
jgi:GH25 family lysozyme M1 (1,4-beta-N-acetylmuramidase)